MKIGIIGMGFVGGATAHVFSKAHEVFGYDKYKKEFSSNEHILNLAKNSEVVFLCVPTPMKPSGEMDYSSVHNSLDFLLEKTKEISRDPSEILVVVRSTAVSGTTDSLAKKYPFKIAFNPEFLVEKTAIQDMENTDRVVIGAGNNEDFEKAKAVYFAMFPNAKYIFLDRRTAEMVKYAANVFLASQIGIANEVYQICKHIGIDYNTVKNTILLDKRIARNISVPGPDGDIGFGGKCFPKDLNALIYLARENQYRPYLLEEVWRSNEKVRTNINWLKIPGATSENKNFKE